MKNGMHTQTKNKPLSFINGQLVKFIVDDIEVTINPPTICETHEHGISRLSKYLMYLKKMEVAE